MAIYLPPIQTVLCSVTLLQTEEFSDMMIDNISMKMIRKTDKTMC